MDEQAILGLDESQILEMAGAVAQEAQMTANDCLINIMDEENTLDDILRRLTEENSKPANGDDPDAGLEPKEIEEMHISLDGLEAFVALRAMDAAHQSLVSIRTIKATEIYAELARATMCAKDIQNGKIAPITKEQLGLITKPN